MRAVSAQLCNVTLSPPHKMMKGRKALNQPTKVDASRRVGKRVENSAPLCHEVLYRKKLRHCVLNGVETSRFVSELCQCGEHTPCASCGFMDVVIFTLHFLEISTKNHRTQLF